MILLALPFKTHRLIPINQFGEILIAIPNALAGINEAFSPNRVQDARGPVSYTHLDVYKRQLDVCR